MKEIKNEEDHYYEIPKFYDFGSQERKEEILMQNFRKVNDEIKAMCKEVLDKQVIYKSNN